MAINPDLIHFDEDDLNGECFIVGAEGEAEVRSNTNVVVFREGMVVAQDATVGQVAGITDADTQAFIYANIAYLVGQGRPIEVAAKVAYVRFLAYRSGIISPDFTTASHHVRYNHSEWRSVDEYNRLLAMFSGEGNVANRNAVTGALSVETRTIIRKNFTDYVCCVAYIFRVRGHHYRDDFQDRYTTLWARCLKGPGDLVLDWEHIATDALHAIMPDVLDGFWQSAVENARCAGTLIKRFDSAPAGCAGVSALSRGLEDVVMLFPGVPERVPDAYEAYKGMMSTLKGSRWGGSVNARFYGVPRIRVDESKIGALASVVMGIYNQLASDSKLRDSPALKRLAEIAPATGGAIGVAARRAAADERFSLLLETERAIAEAGK